MITAVDLLRGLASLIGWDRIDVPGATGYIDTDYAAKGRHAIAALDKFDLICVHIEAPDEASHEGIVERKVAAIEAIDRAIVGPLLGHVQKLPAWRMMVTPDHPTLLATKTHSHGDVPFAVAGTNIVPVLNDGYNERVATVSNLAFPHGHELMKFFIGGN
jgi:2,3-bisphosphoglycerate-independent phosphoglycerate mutase